MTRTKRRSGNDEEDEEHEDDKEEGAVDYFRGRALGARCSHGDRLRDWPGASWNLRASWSCDESAGGGALDVVAASASREGAVVSGDKIRVQYTIWSRSCIYPRGPTAAFCSVVRLGLVHNDSGRANAYVVHAARVCQPNKSLHAGKLSSRHGCARSPGCVRARKAWLFAWR